MSMLWDSSRNLSTCRFNYTTTELDQREAFPSEDGLLGLFKSLLHGRWPCFVRKFHFAMVH